MRLKKAGRNFSGLCPFHKEKSPSFSVNDEKGFYHCFGCGAHGDVISFVMNTKGFSYPEAVEYLANEAGIRIERVERKEEPQKREQENRLYLILEETANFFQRHLASPSGAKAREYIEKRGLKPETVKTFRLGFAPAGFGMLKQHLQEKGFPVKDCVEAGVLSMGDNGDVYDRFRGRLIFPINDVKGRVIAFGGRVLDDGLPKYLNSPETPLFRKSEVLYGFDTARTHIYKDGKALLVEGYLDVISLRQAGFNYAVAPLGTALTRQHLELLWRVTRNAILCLDGDTAGQNAMNRAAETALEIIKPGFELDFCILPEGYDPDVYVNKLGAESFEKLLKNRINLAESIWRRYASEIKGSNPIKKAENEKELMSLAEKISEPVLKKHFRDFFSSRIWQAGRNKNAAVEKKSFGTGIKSAAGDNLSFIETAILKLVLKHPHILTAAETETEFSGLIFSDKTLEGYRRKIEEQHFSGEEISLATKFDRQAEEFANNVLGEGEKDSVPKLWEMLFENHRTLHEEKTRKDALKELGNQEVTEESWKKILEIHSSAK